MSLEGKALTEGDLGVRGEGLLGCQRLEEALLVTGRWPEAFSRGQRGVEGGCSEVRSAGGSDRSSSRALEEAEGSGMRAAPVMKWSEGGCWSVVAEDDRRVWMEEAGTGVGVELGSGLLVGGSRVTGRRHGGTAGGDLGGGWGVRGRRRAGGGEQRQGGEGGFSAGMATGGGEIGGEGC